MTTQFTIVGLGQIGASVGLALGKGQMDIHRIGHDKSPEVAKKAKKIGAVDEVKLNLPASVRKANIVLLSLPVNEIRSTLEIIAPDLSEGTIVLDTAPAQTAVAKWAQEILPERRYYIGLVPAINPIYLHRTELGIEAAEEDLFEDGIVMVGTLPGIPENIINTVVELIKMLGSNPIFADMSEIDGLISSTHIVPS